MPTFNNRIRAGYSIDVTDLINGTPRDAADDNLNSFDPYPPVTRLTAGWARSATSTSSIPPGLSCCPWSGCGGT